MKEFKVLLVFTTLSMSFALAANSEKDQIQNGVNPEISKCLAYTKDAPITSCEPMYVISAMFEKPLSENSTKQSWNKAVSCKRPAGFTLDYDDCNKTLNAYNAVIAAEQSLFAGQTISNTNNIKENQASTEKTIKEGGDLQATAINVNKNHAEHLAKLNQQQANTYYLAFTTLGSAVGAWQSDGKKSSKRHCKEDELKKIQSSETLKELAIESKDKATCLQHLEYIRKNGGSLAFANEPALSFFKSQLIAIGKKAMEAQLRAGNNIKTAETLAKIAEKGNEDSPAPLLDRCMVTPIPKDCIVTNGGQEGIKFQDSDLSLGNGGSNVFGADNNGDSNEDSSLVPGGESKDGQKIADVTSPFEDEAKKARGILDPAAAANVTPGSASSAPGGGGGGGGGGGAPPGGNDLKSASDVEKTGDTKSTAFKATYGSGGGAKFNKVGDGKGGENPFASLFDKSQEGGVEEDRSIASQDISDSSLGLFDKISKKYGQVNADKRIKSDLE